MNKAQRIRELLQTGKCASRQIADRMGCNMSDVRRERRRAGLAEPRNTQRWPAEPKKLALDLINEGHSGTAIAKMVNHQFPAMQKTRNAIIGLAFRHGLHLGGGDSACVKRNHHPVKRKKPRKKSFNFGKNAAASEALQAIRMIGAPLPPPQETDIARVSLQEAEDTACRWPCDDPEVVSRFGLFFCGEDRVGVKETGRPIQGIPYCPNHAQRAFQPLPPRRRDTAMPVPAIADRVLEAA